MNLLGVHADYIWNSCNGKHPWPSARCCLQISICKSPAELWAKCKAAALIVVWGHKLHVALCLQLAGSDALLGISQPPHLKP